jgi:hypothetical protein
MLGSRRFAVAPPLGRPRIVNIARGNLRYAAIMDLPPILDNKHWTCPRFRPLGVDARRALALNSSSRVRVRVAMIEYVPRKSTSPLFGGNSSWRPPIRLPVNYLLIQSTRFLGNVFTVEVPCQGETRLTLSRVTDFVAGRVANLSWRHGSGIVRAVQAQTQFRGDPPWRDLRLF